MSDFLSREADILGNEFSTSLHKPTGSDDIDFDRAASAFPDIDIDSGDFIQSSQPQPPVVAARTSNGFSFDDFGSPPLSQNTAVKVTGDDDFDTFENDFPEIDAGQVSRLFIFRAELSSLPLAILTCYLRLLSPWFCTRDDNFFTNNQLSASFSAAATTRLRCSSTTSIHVFFDPHLDPNYIRGRAPGHQVRTITNILRIVLHPKLMSQGLARKTTSGNQSP
jgi:hypothetical protein